MKIRMNMDSCKNALGTVFLLATAFFVCSTFMSMRSVFADPVVQTPAVRNVRQNARVKRTPSNRTVARSTTSRTTSAQQAKANTTNNATVSRSVSSRTTPSRVGGATRTTNAVSRNVVSRQQNNSRNTNNRAVRARTTTSSPRVGVSGTAMASGATRASTSYAYLTSKLYSNSYSSIIDSSTGLIAAEAYADCLSAYYTCMDEICTARSDTKGRCACAGRATNFLAAEDALEAANEELIQLSGQLSLLVATKGKGDDLASAFSLTDAEKVMNCVSYKEATDKQAWCDEHPTFTDTGAVASCGMPSYCSANGNNFGFDIKNIDGSSSDILAQLKEWAKAKDLAQQYTITDDNDFVIKVSNWTEYNAALQGITDNEDIVTLDTLANKWGYKLFEYAHNNVCGRVLDSCFNGIYESCGNPGYLKDSDNKTHSKCATSATTNCPFNYNSYISVNSDTGDVVLNERGSSTANESAVASCFGYTTTTVATSGTRTTTSSTTDPYFAVRGPVADARRSIMQKYLLDANSACDVYGNSLKQTAQNINYQKIAAQQALQQKRLEFKQEAEAQTLEDAVFASNNFDECLSEILDCYETQVENTTAGGAKWTLSRVKTYCAQISQVPHCYETMICNPSTAQFRAVIDLPDSANCFNSQDYEKNTCRNIVTLNEILNNASVTAAYIAAEGTGNSLGHREKCLLDAGITEIRTWKPETITEVACTVSELRALDANASAGYKENGNERVCKYITACNPGYTLSNNSCLLNSTDCTSEIQYATSAVRTLNAGVWSECTVQSCQTNYMISGNACVPATVDCPASTLNALHATAGTQTWNGASWDNCVATGCWAGYSLVNGACVVH